jgi:hypothetical protein
VDSVSPQPKLKEKIKTEFQKGGRQVYFTDKDERWD